MIATFMQHLRAALWPGSARPCRVFLEPSLAAVPSHPAWAALARFGGDWNRHADILPGLADVSSQAQDPRPEQFIILNPVPLTIAADDKAVRRPYLKLLLDQQEIHAHLCPV